MGPWQKREYVCPQKKHLIPRRQQQLSQRFQKKRQTMFFHANTIKKGQKNAKLWRTCQTPFFHAKPLRKRPNFWNLALKMPTWQPCTQPHCQTLLHTFVKSNFKIYSRQNLVDFFICKYNRLTYWLLLNCNAVIPWSYGYADAPRIGGVGGVGEGISWASENLYGITMTF